MKNIPQDLGYYVSDERKQRQLQWEWNEYVNDIVPERPEQFDAMKDGDGCMDYFGTKREAWPLLCMMAQRTLNFVTSTADVERVFSKWNYYFSRLDAISEGPRHKKARAYLIQNKQHL